MGVIRKAAEAIADKAADILAGPEERTQTEIDRDIASLYDEERAGDGETGGAR